MFWSKSERTCPLIKAPCIKERCEAWYTAMVEHNGAAGVETKPHSACIEFFWKPLYLKGIANRADGTQRACEEMRNEYAKAGLASYEAIGEVARELKTALERRQHTALGHDGRDHGPG